MINMKKVGIILVNYKDYAEKFLSECRDSLRKQTYKNFVVYIVDNASSPETVAYLHKEFPEAVIIPRKDGNYAAANNAGIERASSDGSEYLVIVNMDVKLDPLWLEELVIAFESQENVAFAQSLLLLYPTTKEEWENPKINSLGNLNNFLGFGFTKGYQVPVKDVSLFDTLEIKGYASGCSFITSREVIEKIGGYDEEYYMYHDDLEMSWRAKLAGYKIILVPKSIVYHKYEFARSVRMLYYMERNRFLAILSYYRWPTLILFMPALIFMELGMWMYSILNGWFFTKVKVEWYFNQPKTWKHIFEVRKKIREIRKISDKEILKNFWGKVEFQEIANPLLKYIANPILNTYFKLIRYLIVW